MFGVFDCIAWAACTQVGASDQVDADVDGDDDGLSDVHCLIFAD